MVKKLNELARSGDGQLASGIRTSAHQIWLAGLGAFAKAQKEGTKVFEALVEEGESLQTQTQKIAEETFSGIKAKANKSLEQFSWTQLESVFEDRVARALHSLNVPTRKDLETLSRRVAELTEATRKVSTSIGAPARPRRARTNVTSKHA
jgi:poly(hydroxyalkanoate) granule-associated protein